MVPDFCYSFKVASATLLTHIFLTLEVILNVLTFYSPPKHSFCLYLLMSSFVSVFNLCMQSVLQNEDVSELTDQPGSSKQRVHGVGQVNMRWCEHV